MHVEAGMRSHKLFEPFPEEISRIVTGWMTNYHMCPDQSSVNNLKKSRGIKINLIYNTQADTIKFGLKHSNRADLQLPKSKYVVASIHRYENIFKTDRFRRVIDLLEKVAQKYPIYMPQHPATKEQLEKKPDLKKRLEKNPTIHLLPRLEYLPFIKLIKHSEFVITDGGGNQEELYFMGKPTLLFRYATERPEHIGKTLALSELKEKKVLNFIHNYKKYQHPMVKLKKSPSLIITDILVKFS
jgi:UDP-N-acetylglucosamine 2-epimerase (non-hydrolysing)